MIDSHQLAALNELAIEGLLPMFDAEKGLFCYRLNQTEQGLVREGISHRYTLITLLGLSQCVAARREIPFSTTAIFERMLRDTGWVNNMGDLGLLLWTCSMIQPGRLKEVYAQFDLRNAMDRFPEGREGRTMDLAWFLAGLAHAMLAVPNDLSKLTAVSSRAYTLLKKGQNDHGFFGHTCKRTTVAAALRGHIGSFADQVYPIYAMTRFAQIHNSPAALRSARTCAEAICRAQGPAGQWWWHYDSKSGKVFERYPVFSVHQDGMAPLALFAVGELSGVDFNQPIYRGLQWIYGKNELARDMRADARPVIWRCIYHRRRYGAYVTKALNLFRSPTQESQDDLTILHECRPYHLGWLIYAFAGRTFETTATTNSQYSHSARN